MEGYRNIPCVALCVIRPISFIPVQRFPLCSERSNKIFPTKKFSSCRLQRTGKWINFDYFGISRLEAWRWQLVEETEYGESCNMTDVWECEVAWIVIPRCTSQSCWWPLWGYLAPCSIGTNSKYLDVLTNVNTTLSNSSLFVRNSESPITRKTEFHPIHDTSLLHIGLQYLKVSLQLCAPDDGRRNRPKHVEPLEINNQK